MSKCHCACAAAATINRCPQRLAVPTYVANSSLLRSLNPQTVSHARMARPFFLASSTHFPLDHPTR
eukprot:10927907-Lingulodinium_polyedra.AAC.1